MTYDLVLLINGQANVGKGVYMPKHWCQKHDEAEEELFPSVWVCDSCWSQVVDEVDNLFEEVEDADDRSDHA